MVSNFQHNQLFTEAAESSSNESNNNMDLDSDNKSSDDELELVQICSFYPQILNSEPSHYNHPKSDDWARNVLFNYDEIKFRRTLRMNKPTFFALLNQIKNHSIFHSNSNNFHTEVEIQLVVTLFRLGAPSTIWNVSMLFGIAEEKHGDTWGQSDYIDNQIEIQPEEDEELIDQTLESNNTIQKEKAKIK
ncbi:hypothetical protein C2G38_2046929 [Gigaspora rosea]|uniref:Uncharacterized protein n=1 Tax=Gigaspora rosea TaxID=44941 RepID=A0A397U983_9GLOM|nr:hypothetical protein C2G38_2046929 [Gigaspora rosea]